MKCLGSPQELAGKAMPTDGLKVKLCIEQRPYPLPSETNFFGDDKIHQRGPFQGSGMVREPPAGQGGGQARRRFIEVVATSPLLALRGQHMNIRLESPYTNSV